MEFRFLHSGTGRNENDELENPNNCRKVLEIMLRIRDNKQIAENNLQGLVWSIDQYRGGCVKKKVACEVEVVNCDVDD